MKIIAFFAHPDDETFGPGGTLAHYATTGHTVRLVTFTSGEAGSLGPARYLKPEELGRLRTEELHCAARALHLSSLKIVGFPDKKLAGMPPAQGIGIIAEEIESSGADLVITFHTGGISGHPDHMTVARWCLDTVRASSRSIRLLGFGISESQARLASFRELRPIPDREVTHVIDVSASLSHKLAAIECHCSQSSLWRNMQAIQGGYAAYAGREYFTQMWPELEPGAPRRSRFEE